MTPIELLRAAQAKVAAGWCQGDFAQKADGSFANVTDEAACRFCIDGALYSAIGVDPFDAEDAPGSEYYEAVSALRRVINDDSVVPWNDAEGRTQAEVVNAFENAIVQLEIRG